MRTRFVGLMLAAIAMAACRPQEQAKDETVASTAGQHERELAAQNSEPHPPSRFYTVQLDTIISEDMARRSPHLTKHMIRQGIGKPIVRSFTNTGTPLVGFRDGTERYVNLDAPAPIEEKDYNMRVHLAGARGGGYALSWTITGDGKTVSGQRRRSLSEIGATSRSPPFPATGPGQLNHRIWRDLNAAGVDLCGMMGAAICQVPTEFRGIGWDADPPAALRPNPTPTLATGQGR